MSVERSRFQWLDEAGVAEPLFGELQVSLEVWQKESCHGETGKAGKTKAPRIEHSKHSSTFAEVQLLPVGLAR